MDSLQAYARGQAARAVGARQMVFDWDRAATLIRERGAKDASAGLRGDWKYTGGEILRDGKPIDSGDTYTYLSSNWATPELDIDGAVIECWRYEEDTPGWNSGTYWPDSARAILASDDFRREDA